MLKLSIRILVIVCLVALLEAERNLDEVDLSAVGESIKNMGFALYRSKAPKPGNILISPLSASTIFALCFMGAEGKTAKEMAFSLLLPNDKLKLAQSFQGIINNLKGNSDVTFNLVNKLYPSLNIQIKDAFRQVAQTSFNAEIEPLDFTNPEQTAEKINQYVESKTNNKIKNLVSPNSLNPLGGLILINAIYFNGRWSKKFESAGEMEFFESPQIVKKVPAMKIYGKFSNGYDPILDAQILELPYTDPDYALLIILPKEIDGITSIDEKTPLNLEKLVARLKPHKMHIYMPKFKLEQTIDLKEEFSNLAMSDAFTSAANFSGISDQPIYISDAKQKAMIEVNEEGTEAAAGSAVSFVFLSSPRIFNVNRPFLFVLYKKSINMPIMLGRVSEFP